MTGEALATTRVRKLWVKVAWRRLTEVEGVAVIKPRGNNGVTMVLYLFWDQWTNTAKLTNVRLTRFRLCSDLVRKSEMFIEDNAKIASSTSLNRPTTYGSWMGGIKRGIACFSFRSLLPPPTNTKLCLAWQCFCADRSFGKYSHHGRHWNARIY